MENQLIQTAMEKRRQYQAEKEAAHQMTAAATQKTLMAVIDRIKAEAEANRAAGPTSLKISLPHFTKMIYQGVTKPQVTSHPQLKSAVKTLFNWYNEGAPYSLIIAGNPGSGKSTMLRAMQMMIGGKFRTEYDLLNAYSQTRAEAIQQIKGNGLIFLDDVGVEKIPPFVKQQDEKIDDYFHGFYTVLFDYHGEPNRYTRFCISTNLDVDAFFRRIGDRASSRIQGLIGSKDHFIRLFDVPNFRAEGWIKS